jgi:phosphoribosylformylglycinamidine synthase
MTNSRRLAMLWQVEIRPTDGEVDREGLRVVHDAQALGARSVGGVRSARLFLLQGELSEADARRSAESLLVDPVVETYSLHRPDVSPAAPRAGEHAVHVLLKPGVTDNVAHSAQQALKDLGFAVDSVATGRSYWFATGASRSDVQRIARRLLANDAIERVIEGPLALTSLDLGGQYQFQLTTVRLAGLNDRQLEELSRSRQLSLSLDELHTIQKHFAGLGRDPTDIELETIAQTWSEHCSHKTLKGRIAYRDEHGERRFENMLKETVFAATETVRERLGAGDWCVSVFQDNAGVVKFTDDQHVCFKVETHNHPSAIEPYGGANTGIGGVIRDPLGTGLGAKPICNTDVFCFAPPDTPDDSLPQGVLHPRAVAKGVVAGVRDYGNRMGIPTVNGAIYFDERYLGNPLVYCGTAALLPVDRTEKRVSPGDWIVAVGGRTGRDGIHGATFSSIELTEDSETVSGGAVQIGNAIAEKMLLDVILQARDRGLYHAITDCGAGGFSSAVGEMGEHTGAEVWLDRAPLKYAGLSYTEIWISEAQERMVLAVPPESWSEFHALCAKEGVEATIIGRFTDTRRLVLKYQDRPVGELAMSFLHDGRPPVIREAVFTPPPREPFRAPARSRYDEDLLAILGSLNVCSKHWVIRQYDHEVQAASVVKPLVGASCDGPSDAAVLRPLFHSPRGLVIANGMNPRYGDLDPYWMAAAAIDEALRNTVAVGADPQRIAILDNFCWGNTNRPETLGSLVRAAIGCHDTAVAFGVPFISGKDSLNNEFSYQASDGSRRTVSIPPSLLISAIGQMDDAARAVTMDLKQPESLIYQLGVTREELGGSHWGLVTDAGGGTVPRVDFEAAPQILSGLHRAIEAGYVLSCHDLSEGGLAVAAAEMAFAGGLGLDIDLPPLQDDSLIQDAGVLLFSESCTRFLVEVPAASSREFEALFDADLVTLIGETARHDRLRILTGDGDAVIDLPLSVLKAAWQRPLDWE